MKWHWAAPLAALAIGFAASSPIVMAQSVPAAEPPPADIATVQPFSSSLHPISILAYRPPTAKEKWRVFRFDAFGPYALATATLAGGYQQASTSPPEWGSGWDGFGRRVASNFGIQVVTTTTRYGIAALFREDAAYYRCECRGFFPRLGHGLISTLTGRRGADGHTALSVSRMVSPYAGTMAALAWYPDRFGVKDGFRMGNYNLLGQVIGNLGREFIYGGPRTMFRRRGQPNASEDTAADQNR